MQIAFRRSKFMLRGGWPSCVLLVVCTAAAGLWIAATFRPVPVEASLPPPTDAPAVAKPRLKTPTPIPVVASAHYLERLFVPRVYNHASVPPPARTVPKLLLGGLPATTGQLPAASEADRKGGGE